MPSQAFHTERARGNDEIGVLGKVISYLELKLFGVRVRSPKQSKNKGLDDTELLDLRYVLNAEMSYTKGFATYL